MPPIGIVELAWLRKIRDVTNRRARIHPFHDGLNLVLSERRVILEALKANVRIDAPRRHLARDDALLDGANPRPHVLIRQQRHRRHLPWAMTVLAGALQDAPDVLR